MRYEWYIDLYLLINLLMDAGLLWSLGKVFQIPLRWRQIVSGAAFGAVGACGEAWIRLLFLDIGTKMGVPVAKAFVRIQVISIVLLVLFPAGMIRLCFGRRDWRTFLKLYVMLYLEAFLAGGILEAVRQQVEVRGVPFWAVFFLTAGVFLLIRFFYLFYQDVKEERKYCYPVVLKYGKQKVNAIGYLDTGNQLVRPKDRVPVHVVSEQVWKQLFDGADKEEKIPDHSIFHHWKSIWADGSDADRGNTFEVRTRKEKSPGKTMDRQSAISHQQGKPVPDPASRRNRS